MGDLEPDGLAPWVSVGIDREVQADRRYWYLTRWMDVPSLPVRPDGQRARLSRTIDDGGTPQLPELMVARWLGRDAAYWAWFDRWWGGRWRQAPYVYPDQASTSPPPWVGDLLRPVIERHGGWDGVWDAVAAWQDGRVSFAEAKRRGGDRLRPSQHAFASAAKSVLGDRVSFTVVEWTAAAPLDWRECGYECEEDYSEQRNVYLSDAEFVARWYRWTQYGQPFDRWLLESLPSSGAKWLSDHHLRRQRQHDRFFVAMEKLRAESTAAGSDGDIDS